MRTTSATGGRRPVAIGAAVVTCIALAVSVAACGGDRPTAGHPRDAGAPPTTRPSALMALMAQPHILFRSSRPGADFGRIEIVPLARPGAAPVPTPISCDRFDMADGVGFCGTIHVGPNSYYEGEIVDSHFRIEHRFPMQGIADRVRVAPDGRWASVTEFVYGDSYAASNFSTRVEFIDLRNGDDIGNLESFTVTESRAVVGAINRNYWGVTFAADSDHFYATQSVGGDIRLIAGRLSTRRARTGASHVECPSLSPDQTRIAYKYRTGTGPNVRWRLHVLDLATGADHALAETRSVDDQVEWLDNDTVLYALPAAGAPSASDVWSVPADGGGPPKLLIPWASSPSVSRVRQAG